MTIDTNTWVNDLCREYSNTSSSWTPLEGAIRLVLFVHPDKDSQGYVGITHAELKERAGGSERSTGRALATLVKDGCISMKKGNPHKYRVIFYEEYAEQQEEDAKAEAA